MASAAQSSPVSGSKRSYTRLAAHLAGGALVLAWALHFYWPSLRSHFAIDDPMNLHRFWMEGWTKIIENIFLFFTTSIRPVAGLYFLSLYSWFRLDPFPYHVVLVLLLLFNTWLAYRLGKLITGSSLIGGLVAIGTAYHPRMAQLAFLPAFVFDVLCFTFYFLALNCYLAARTRGQRLTARRTALVLAFYVLALGSKEMAVTLPAVLLCYELLFHRPARWSPAALFQWLRSDAMPVVTTGILTLVYIIGKTTGSGTLTDTPEFKLHLGWARYLDSTSRFMQTILYRRRDHPEFEPYVLVVWLVCALLCWWVGKRILWWLLAFMIIAPLPITFLVGRGDACLYIPLAAWTAFAAILVISLAEQIAKLPLARRAPAMILVMVALAAAIRFYGLVSDRNKIVPAQMIDSCARTWTVIRDLRRPELAIKPGSSVYILNDTFGGYDTYMILRLFYRDKNFEPVIARIRPLTPAEQARMDYIFTYDQDHLKLLKKPGSEPRP